MNRGIRSGLSAAAVVVSLSTPGAAHAFDCLSHVERAQKAIVFWEGEYKTMADMLDREDVVYAQALAERARTLVAQAQEAHGKAATNLEHAEAIVFARMAFGITGAGVP